MLGALPKDRETRRRTRVEAGQSSLRLLFEEREQNVLALWSHSCRLLAGTKLDHIRANIAKERPYHVHSLDP